MAPNRTRKDLIGFILYAEDSNTVTGEFLSKKDAPALLEFFQKEGFTDINQKDSEDILKCIVGANGVSIDVKGIAAAAGVKCY